MERADVASGCVRPLPTSDSTFRRLTYIVAVEIGEKTMHTTEEIEIFREYVTLVRERMVGPCPDIVVKPLASAYWGFQGLDHHADVWLPEEERRISLTHGEFVRRTTDLADALDAAFERQLPEDVLAAHDRCRELLDREASTDLEAGPRQGF